MSSIKSRLFTPGRIGPIKLRNRSIRSAAFEGMCPGGIPSSSLVNYHRSVAEGGIGMTTVAYVAVNNSGRSFAHQAWMNEQVVPHFKKLTDAVHKAGALASVQLGHCGNMSDRKVTKEPAYAPSSLVNLYGLVKPRAMSEADIEKLVKDFGRSTLLAKKAGFDAVEIHAGHGYLISQFLSPYTNRRTDRYGGTLENRARLLREVMAEVKKAAGKDMAVVVKTNLRDGFKGGMDIDEAIEVARILEQCGADALVLSGGFVSKTPMYVMRGQTPHRDLIRSQSDPLIKVGMFLFSRLVIKDFPFKENYFFEDALRVRGAVKLPLIYVGGVLSLDGIDRILSAGFDFVAMARALIIEPDFVNKLRSGASRVSLCSECGPCNRCIATMYNDEAVCVFDQERRRAGA